ncbi:acVLRF1 family peptidyl-tRNA hydrolase [Actinopolyspora erythraea]|uniref:acVLRF1 family peptidyl-tRNA hydrolase n=1 Tax=Actinopolyspora erythraea TaxID=414996 RepID=UPI0005BC932C|nr:acVLRF1 family peptidyl-tRNA hydrolase [Actinopolyspora erythraea]
MSSRVRQLPGGGRAVEVEPDRLSGWFERFARRHGGVARSSEQPSTVRVTAVDGAEAVVRVPFGGLDEPSGESEGLVIPGLLEHVSRSRRLGLVLVRHGAHSIGVVQDREVVASSTDRHYVQGKTKAGGWSQKRYARRRAGQSRKAVGSAAGAVAELLLPVRRELDGIVVGGDRAALDELSSDARLAGLLGAAEPRVLDVPEPRLAVLREAAGRAISVEVEVREPGE